MTLNIQPGMVTHQSGSRITTVAVAEDAGLRIRVKNGPDSVNVDEFTREERITLARVLLNGLNWGPNFRIEDFANGFGGPNEREDRRAYVDSFGPLLGKSDTSARDLQTWIDHEDSSWLMGEWDERIRTYYRDRGYSGLAKV